MDVISLGKAMNTLRDIKELNNAIVGKEAEGRFKTVDHRLDWIEGQADKIMVERSKKIDLSSGEFEDIEYIDEKLQLKIIKKEIMPHFNWTIIAPKAKNISSSITNKEDMNEAIGGINTERVVYYYSPQGIWTSPIIDLGIGWKETNTFNVLKQTTDKSNIEIQVATSQDGISFTDFKTLDESLPQTRYLKIKAILSAEADIAAEDKQLEFNQSHEENMIALNKFTEADGKLRLKTNYTLDMIKDIEWRDEGSVHKKLLKRNDWKQIRSIGV